MYRRVWRFRRPAVWVILKFINGGAERLVGAYNRRGPEAKPEIPAGATGALKTVGPLGKRRIC